MWLIAPIVLFFSLSGCGVAGMDGADGKDGAPGASGPTGPQGEAGPPGPPAIDPTAACPGILVSGTCVGSTSTIGSSFLSAATTCANQGADLCTDSQSWVLRKAGLLAWPNWTNSFSDNDVSGYDSINGKTADNHPASTLYVPVCCFNVTPSRQTDKLIAGVRVVRIHNAEDQDWNTAALTCSLLNSDLCDKGQYTVLRQAGAVTVKVWASDHSDNDGGIANEAIGMTMDNPDLLLQTTSYGFACCAGSATRACPVPLTSGVCAVSVHNAAGLWPDAAQDCAAQGARVCSIAQSAILRNVGSLTAASNWVGSRGDNDGSFASVGVGAMLDDPLIGSSSGWACCL